MRYSDTKLAEIREMLAEGPITADDIVIKFNVSVRFAHHYIHRLQQLGHMRATGAKIEKEIVHVKKLKLYELTEIGRNARKWVRRRHGTRLQSVPRQ